MVETVQVNHVSNGYNVPACQSPLREPHIITARHLTSRFASLFDLQQSVEAAGIHHEARHFPIRHRTKGTTSNLESLNTYLRGAYVLWSGHCAKAHHSILFLEATNRIVSARESAGLEVRVAL